MFCYWRNVTPQRLIKQLLFCDNMWRRLIMRYATRVQSSHVTYCIVGRHIHNVLTCSKCLKKKMTSDPNIMEQQAFCTQYNKCDTSNKHSIMPAIFENPDVQGKMHTLQYQLYIESPNCVGFIPTCQCHLSLFESPNVVGKIHTSQYQLDLKALILKAPINTGHYHFYSRRKHTFSQFPLFVRDWYIMFMYFSPEYKHLFLTFDQTLT